MARAKKAEKATSRTFEGTRKGDPFTIETCLSNAAAVEKLRAMAPDGVGFAADCADHIELMELGETRKLPVKFRANLVAWGFRLIEDAANRVTLTLSDKLRSRVAFRKPLAMVAGDEPVVIQLCGTQSKHAGRYRITNGLGYGDPGQAFYGFAEPDGTWSPTRSTPDSVIEAIKNA